MDPIGTTEQTGENRLTRRHPGARRTNEPTSDHGRRATQQDLAQAYADRLGCRRLLRWPAYEAQLGIPVGLGADWLPSGSTSLLAELKVAERTLARQGHPLAPRQLVEMVTSTAAQIAGLANQLGSLETGWPADLVVLERRREDPYASVVAADPSWVQLVTVDGDLAYGRADWLGDLVDPADRDRLEPVLAWGTPMLLDTSYRARPTSPQPPPTLAELREALIAHYPQVGPIFA
jgi:5-methylthioadenosine/S-adenosylhomocysteine deaminase